MQTNGKESVKIAAIGDLASKRAGETVDATGRAVAPGFIGASRCHPIGAPGGYSVTSASAQISVSVPAHSATACRNGSRKSGIGCPGPPVRRSKP